MMCSPCNWQQHYTYNEMMVDFSALQVMPKASAVVQSNSSMLEKLMSQLIPRVTNTAFSSSRAWISADVHRGALTLTCGVCRMRLSMQSWCRAFVLDTSSIQSIYLQLLGRKTGAGGQMLNNGRVDGVLVYIPLQRSVLEL
jgi:hypothetical protein